MGACRMPVVPVVSLCHAMQPACVLKASREHDRNVMRDARENVEVQPSRVVDEMCLSIVFGARGRHQSALRGICLGPQLLTSWVRQYSAESYSIVFAFFCR